MLRPDQSQFVSDVRATFAAGHRDVLGICPTGWGKTYVAAHILESSVALGNRVAFLTDREEIALDTVVRFRTAGLHTGLVMADEPADADAPVQVAMIPTCTARSIVPAASFAIWDECHHMPASTWTALGDAMSAQGCRFLGITATGQRGDGAPLAPPFTAVVHGPSTRWCIERGLLVPVHVIAPPDVEERGLCTSPVKAYQQWTPEGKAIVFCANVEHVEVTVQEFLDAGVPSVGIVADTDRVTRRTIRDRVTAGDVRALVGCGVFIEGFDLPAIDTVILARPFGATGTYLQAIGRGLRIFPGKESCTVLDLRGSVHTLGLPDEDREWRLDGDAVVRTERMPALMRCKVTECGAIFRPAARCPRCNAPTKGAAKLPRVFNRAERLMRLESVPVRVRDGMYLHKLERVARDRMRMSEWSAGRWAIRQFEKTRGRKPEATP